MNLLELTSKLTNVPITIMHNNGDNHYTLIYQGDSRFFRPTEVEGDLWVHHIAPHKYNIGEIFIMCED